MLRDIATAVRLLSVLPLGSAEGTSPVAYFAWVGWLFAALGAAIASAAHALGVLDGLRALVVAVMIVAGWAVLSGFLHWDGLADAADGLGARGDAACRLAVMRDSATGAFGVTAIVFVALLQVTSLAVVLASGSWWALGAPVFGRLAASAGLWYRRPASATGLASRYSGRASAGGVMIALLPLLPLALAPFPPVLPRAAAALAGITFGVLVPSLFTRRLGGVNGDVLGATVLLTETFVLVLGALAGGLL